MRNFFVFDGENTLNYGVYCNGHNTYGGAYRDVESIAVPGRNGDILLDNGRYNNLALSYECFVVEDMKRNVALFRNMLTSRSDTYYRLEDSYHPDEFRLAQYVGGFESEISMMHRTATFNVEFNCKPQRFLKSGENWIDNPSTIRNDWQESKPVIRCTGAQGTFMLNGNTVTILNHNTTTYPYIDIDCEAMECHYNGTNAGQYVTIMQNKFPTLVPGNNTLTRSGLSVQIQPRWWRL